jgi:hypothetical protein
LPSSSADFLRNSAGTTTNCTAGYLPNLQEARATKQVLI